MHPSIQTVQILSCFFFFFSFFYIPLVLGIDSSHKPRTPKSARDNSLLINSQLSNISSETSSLQSSGQFEFDDLPTWTVLLPNESSITSPTDDSDGELQLNDDIDSDVNKAVPPHKRQKTQIGSNAQIMNSNVLVVKSRDKKAKDGSSKKRKLPSLQDFAMPTVLAADLDSDKDTCVSRVLAISNTAPSSTTLISSCVQIDPSPTTIIRTTPALSQQNAHVKEGKEGNSPSTHSRKRANGLSGLLVSRPLGMSRSTSTTDSLNSRVLKDHEEPPRKIRGLAFRPTNWSYGTLLKKKLRGRIADQDQLELWTDTDVAHNGFRKPDELKLLEKVEEESTKRNVSHILTCLMEIEAGRSSENVARNEGAISNYCVQTRVATAESVGEKRVCKAPERTKMVKNIWAVRGLEGQKDEETRDDVNSLQVPLSQLKDWSTTLRSLSKGKKKFQHQVCCDCLFSLSNFSKLPFRT